MKFCNLDSLIYIPHGFSSPISVGTRYKLTREAEFQLLTKAQEYFTNKYPFGSEPKDLITEKDLAPDDGRTGTRCNFTPMSFDLFCTKFRPGLRHPLNLANVDWLAQFAKEGSNRSSPTILLLEGLFLLPLHDAVTRFTARDETAWGIQYLTSTLRGKR